MTTAALHTGNSERRRRRSDDIITALHYQLSLTRHEADLDAVVLVDDRGCLVAGAGAWPACEELAAYAPLLAMRAIAVNETVSSRVSRLSGEVEVCTLAVGPGEAVLCSRGGSALRAESLARAAAGCLRILRQ